MPVAWSELQRVDPVAYDIDSAPLHLREHGDPWADILSRKNDLSPLLGAAAEADNPKRARKV
jgi:DNA primase